MKTLKMFVLLTMFLLGSLCVKAVTPVPAPPAPLQLWMSASPANPIVGEEVTWTVYTTGGATLPATHQLRWNSTSNIETPGLFSWGGGPYPYYYVRSMKFKYLTSGTKTIIITASDGVNEITRSLSMTVFAGRITLITPNGGEVWEVGKTYEIKWLTEGLVNDVQVRLYDSRFSAESSAGQQIIETLPNVNSYFFKVPPPSATGISAGNLGGKNYRISVIGFDAVAGGISASNFTIKLPTTRR